ncbi:transcription termination factor 5, mitochondrial [Parasteatoda tepidariorum]|nr:uncharacterized protein LOC122270812 [Parasteatoda tepidariorum]
MVFFLKSLSYGEKIFLGYKHIRLKSSAYSSLTELNLKEAVNCRITRLSEILDCTYFTAKKIVSHNSNIIAITSDTFLRNSEFCRKHLKFSDVVEFPLIISYNPSLLQHRYFSLMELGCSNISVSYIIRFPQILKKSPTTLRKDGIIFNADSFLETYLHLIDCENQSEVESRFYKMYRDGSSLWEIKTAMNAEFLSLKLNCSLVAIHRMFKKYPPLRTQSILNTNLLLDVLFKDFQFPLSKVFSVPNLLSLHPEIALKFLSDIPTILGINTIELINKFPIVLRRPVCLIKRAENILKEYSITGDQLMCCPKIINFNPSTLQQRLEKLCNSEDFSLLISYKKFLWLVYHYSILERRLHSLKERGIPCSISVLTTSESQFDQYLSASDYRTCIKEICFYLAGVFSCTEILIREKLKEYPNIYDSSLTNCRKIVEFLLDAGVSKNQLLTGIGVVFYDFEVVKTFFHEMQNHDDCQPFADWINHYNLIQLLIYKIEVEAGLYRVTGNSDDYEELSMESV